MRCSNRAEFEFGGMRLCAECTAKALEANPKAKHERIDKRQTEAPKIPVRHLEDEI